MKLQRTAIALLAIGTLAFQAGLASAQSNPAIEAGKMGQAEIQASWAMQAQLAQIEANKAAFAQDLISQWASIADPQKYSNLREELSPLVENATAWQLYAASLVGDFTGMTQVLKGKASPASYINALHGVAQPKSAASMAGPFAVGSTTDTLAFTPIPPCRIMDTRGSGARTGIIVPGTPRTVDLTQDAYGKGQGGQTSGCTGLPPVSPYGWSANITVVGFSGGNGALVAYPSAGSAPSTSLINYYNGPFAIANSSTLTGCYLCNDDIVLAALGVGTHVIVDVMGYYDTTTGGSGINITKLAGTTTSVAAGAFQAITGAVCPSGTHAIGGAQTNGAFGTIITSDHNLQGSPSDQWYENVKNTGGSSSTVTVYTTCQDEF